MALLDSSGASEFPEEFGEAALTEFLQISLRELREMTREEVDRMVLFKRVLIVARRAMPQEQAPILSFPEWDAMGGTA